MSYSVQIVFFYLISLIFIIYGFLKIISFIWVFIFLKKIKTKYARADVLETDKNLIFILPVYQETKMMTKTVAYYKKYLEQYDNVELIIVGTKRERNKNNINETLQLTDNLTEGIKRIKIMEYPKATGHMAHQVNFACRQLFQIGYDPQKTWIHIINIDSRVGDDYFGEVFYYLRDGRKILLQSTVFTLNFDVLPKILQGASILQSSWTITGEQSRLLINKYISKSKLYHVVGHGLIISLEIFKKYNFFPENTFNEDLHFGYYLSMEGEDITIMSSYEIGDMPNNFKDWWKQSEGWFISTLEYHKYLQSYLNIFGKKVNLRSIFMVLQGWFNSIKWISVSYLFIAEIVFMIVLNKPLYYLIGFLSIIIYLMTYWLTIFLLKSQGFIKKGGFVSYILTNIFIVLIRSFPPTIALIKFLSQSIGLTVLNKYKTIHE